MNERITDVLQRSQIENQIRFVVMSLIVEDRELIPAMVLVAALFVGPNPSEIANLVGIDQATVEEIALRLQKSEAWTPEGTQYGTGWAVKTFLPMYAWQWGDLCELE